MARKAVKRKPMRGKEAPSPYPIKYWSHSSLMAYLRNPLAWYKRYVKKIYDTPRTPASIVGSAGHLALENFYSGVEKEIAIAMGLEYLRKIPDFEINFGVAKTKREQKKKRESMERQYLQAINYYLEKPPRHTVLAIEVSGIAKVPGLPLPVKAISDLVVESKGNPGAVDIVDHKFVDAFSGSRADKPAFLLQAMFNFYTVSSIFKRPVKRFIVWECRKRKNADGKSQMRKYVIEYDEQAETFELFNRILKDATQDMKTKRVYLPNPSDMFEGENSFDVYRLKLLD